MPLTSPNRIRLWALSTIESSVGLGCQPSTRRAFSELARLTLPILNGTPVPEAVLTEIVDRVLLPLLHNYTPHDDPTAV